MLYSAFWQQVNFSLSIIFISKVSLLNEYFQTNKYDNLKSTIAWGFHFGHVSTDPALVFYKNEESKAGSNLA